MRRFFRCAPRPPAPPLVPRCRNSHSVDAVRARGSIETRLRKPLFSGVKIRRGKQSTRTSAMQGRVKVSFATHTHSWVHSHSREGGNPLPKPLEMRPRRTRSPPSRRTGFAGMTGVSKGMRFQMTPLPKAANCCFLSNHFGHPVGASGARPRAERRSALPCILGCGLKTAPHDSWWAVGRSGLFVLAEASTGLPLNCTVHIDEMESLCPPPQARARMAR